MQTPPMQPHDVRAAIRAAVLELWWVADCVVFPASVDAARAAEGFRVYVATRGHLTEPMIVQHIRTHCPHKVGPLHVVLVPTLPLSDTEAALRTSGMGTLDEAVVDTWQKVVDGLLGAEAWQVSVEDRAFPPGALRLRRPPQASPVTGGRTTSARRPDASTRRAFTDGGPALTGPEKTLVDVLLSAVEQAPGQRMIHLEGDGLELPDTYQELLQRARRVAGGLRAAGLRPGQTVLLQLAGTFDFITALWGALLAGVVPAPVAVPAEYVDGVPGISKLVAAWTALHRPLVITQLSRLDSLRSFARDAGHALKATPIEELTRQVPVEPYRDADPDSVALLLFTSGSTGMPKTVPLTHRAILTEARGSAHVKKMGPEDVSFSWMPLEHGGSIAMMHTRNLLSRCAEVHVPTQLILGEPLRWLDWMERYRASLSWAPHFAFGLIVGELSRMTGERRWDLSRVRILINGGEAISARVARQFLKALAPHGLRGSALCPAWGMSETSSGVTYGLDFRLDTTSDEDEVVSLGPPIPGVRLRIVDDSDAVVAEGEVGSLQIHGDTLLRGYVENDVANRESFTSEGWFRTGDQGYLLDGRLTLTGRSRDTIIINGANHFGHEIEATVESLPFIDRSFTAACAVRVEGAVTDELALFFHLLPGTSEQEALPRIRSAVARVHGVNPAYLLPVERADIPKTDLGKIQRPALARRFASRFAARNPEAGHDTLPAWFFHRVWRASPLAPALPANEPVLLVADSGGLAEAVRRELSRRGQPCVTVLPTVGPDVIREGPHRFRMDVENPAHHRDLLQALRTAGFTPRHVLHLAGSATPDLPRTPEAHRDACLRVCGGIVPMLKALDALAPRQVLLKVITLQGQRVNDEEPLYLPHAVARGLLAGASLELRWLRVTHLDLPRERPEANARRILSEVDALTVEPEVAWRGDQRFVTRMVPSFPEGSVLDASMNEQGGLVVLTGGLGTVGRQVADWLIRQKPSRMLILGRTQEAALSDEQQAALTALREQGRVDYQAVDVLDAQSVLAAIEQAEFLASQPVSRVFHLAGHYEERPLLETTPQTLATALGPKLAGAWNLWQVVRQRPDAQLVLFSSAVATLGGAFQAAYAASNAALDAFAEQCQQEVQGEPCAPVCRSIGWSYWRGDGTRELEVTGQATARGYALMEPAQALASLPFAVRAPRASGLVGVLPGGHLLRSRVERPPAPLRDVVARGPGRLKDAARATVAPIRVTDALGVAVPLSVEETTGAARPASDPTASTRRLRQLFADVLGQPDVGDEDDFFDRGGNSIQLARLHRGMEALFQREIRWADVLRCRTVKALADLLAGGTAQETRFLTKDGLRFAYRVVAGPARPLIGSPIIIASGAFQDMYAMPKLERLLHPLGELIMVDLPGSGVADDLPPERGFDFLADCIEHLREHLEVPRVHLVGISYGGSTAYEFAHRYPDRVDHLVIVGASTELPEDSLARFDVNAEVILEGQLESFVQKLVAATMTQDPSHHVREAESTRQLVEKAFHQVTPREARRYTHVQNRLLARARDPEDSPMHRPALVFTGEYDPITPPGYVRRLAQTLPGALFTTVREADHLVLMERPEEMADLIRRFLQDQDLGGLDYTTAIEHPTPPRAALTSRDKPRGGIAV
ncbi:MULTISPECIES: alpha/beta fold hydrolase [unclassified Corallococcus]|uniref:alpha/beta fold hydrolase n=1 Tax=unclassified Corallococcus TaxID=2685029 RepID=UPI001A8E47B7|nr:MULTISPECIES: alpha/beta fold hydrolase [unclassified Corallococcus]MBN9686172.1 alpha/beta fold hydrolase [Corallococcus sp. NCSPR001]WAS82396.1 alpha/beta fold hydrolase [Corallococcus sp. NCRR]